MSKLIHNDWRREPGQAYERARILSPDTCPEGLHVSRLRFVQAGSFAPSPSAGHLLSLISGRATLSAAASQPALSLEAGCHLYLPPDQPRTLQAEAGCTLVLVSSPDGAQARGDRLLLRDETFLSAAASDAQLLRWILTPQYLSRRIFLHHDRVLSSKAGQPVSWFRTTMFDVAGLPPNDEGESVFKMSYNSRTEFNVCYQVTGDARVRFAEHPYQGAGQRFDVWQTLDDQTTYHLDEEPMASRLLRNKHEVRCSAGQVSLFCLFDPAPTGVERHKPGAYSDYEPLADVIARPEYAEQQRVIGRLDAMVDALSLAKAQGRLEAMKGSAEWADYQAGKSAQRRIEAALIAGLVAEKQGREQIVAPFTQP